MPCSAATPLLPKPKPIAELESGVSAEVILNEACIPAMTEVGRLFEIGEKFVPEMLISARANVRSHRYP